VGNGWYSTPCRSFNRVSVSCVYFTAVFCGQCRGRFVKDPYTPPYVSHQPDLHHLRLDPQDRYILPRL
jgi:hypothetical protein